MVVGTPTCGGFGPTRATCHGPPAGLLKAIAQDDDQIQRNTEAAFRGPIVDRRGRPLAISSPGIQLFVDLVARREKHEFEMSKRAHRFPEGVTPATEWNLQLMDFALEVAHLFPGLRCHRQSKQPFMKPNKKSSRRKRHQILQTGRRTAADPSLVDRQRVAKEHETESFLQDCTGMKWRSDRPAAQSLRSLIGKTVPAPQGLTGLYGIEAECNAQLTGTMGQRQDVVDTQGRRLSGAAAQPAIDGRTVTMTLDLDLQRTPQHNCKKQWHPATPPVDS